MNPRFTALIVFIISLLIIPGQIFSQETTKRDTIKNKTEEADTLEYGLQDITVVGTRTKEKIIDIPYSVFSVNKEELNYGKKVSARSVLADVPGLFLQSRYGGQDLRVSIRGFGNRSSTGIRGIRILQDGIPESEPDGETVLDAIDFTSLAGVEVVKGNLSSLYANAPGGVIDFKTDYHFNQNYAATYNQVGKFGFRQNGFKLGLKNSDNRFYISYYYRNLDGYRKHSEEDQHLLNAIYEGYLGTRTSITLLGNYVDGFNRLPGPLTKAEYESDPLMASPLAVAKDFRRITKKGRLAVKYLTGFGAPDENEIEIDAFGGIKELTKVDNDSYTLSTRYSLGSLTRYTNRGHILNFNNVFTTGFDFAFQSGPVNAFENIAGNRDISVKDSYDASLSSVGFYFLNHINFINDKLGLFISSRYDISSYKKNTFQPFGRIDSAVVFSGLTPKVGINFKLIPEIALYTSYGLSYDFPALSELDITSDYRFPTKYTLNQILEPQRSQNLEVGIKGNIINPGSEFMNKIIFDITYFHYIISDELVPSIISYDQILLFKNAAKTRRDGIEIGVTTHPFEETEMTVNYTYTDFKYSSYKTTISTASADNLFVDYSGNYEPSVPQQIVNFIFNYEFELNDELSGLLQWDCDYLSKLYVDDANSETSPAYFYGNIMGGITYQGKLFSAVLYAGINNIFDKKYIGFINTNDYLQRYYEPGEPRSFYSGINIHMNL
jgi:iron complex outermembrane recepter protein